MCSTRTLTRQGQRPWMLRCVHAWRMGAWLCAAATVFAQTGCTGMLSAIKKDSAADTARADSLMGKVREGDNRAKDSDGVVVSNQLWLSGSTIKVAPSNLLPGVFDEHASFDGSVDSLRGFADRLMRMTHLAVKVSPGADEAAMRATQSGNALVNAGAPNGGGPMPPLPTGMLQSPPVQGRHNDIGIMQSQSTPLHLVYAHGDLRGLLDMAAARFGVSWKYQDGAIVFFYTDTQVFQVSAIPGDSKLDASVISGSSNSGGLSGGSGGGGSGSTSASGGSGGTGGGSSSSPSISSDNSTNIGMNAELSVYSGLVAGIKAMLSPAGSVVPSPATGSMTVTDTPEVLERVGEFMAQQNRVLSRQILVNVTVLSVTLSADDSYGIDWNAVYQTLGTRFNIANTFTSLPGLSESPGQVAATVITPNSRASGTTAMISALSDQGTVRRKTSAAVTTLNDQPVPVQVAEQQSYLAQVSSTATLNVGTQTSLTAGTVSTGFNMTLLPHILDDGTVMMQFYTNISSLKSLDSVTSGTSTIQVPTVDTRNFLQRVAMKSGQTLVISGYEGIADNGTQQGIGNASNYALGGGYNGQRSREVIVILLSPVTLSGA